MNRYALAGFVVGLLVALAPSCGGPRPCTPSNCRGCCQNDGVCEFGQTLGACGAGGVACLSCSRGQACTAGLCQDAGGGTGGGGESGGGAGGGGGGAGPVDSGVVDQRMRIFVTRTRYTGALGGLIGADSLCQTNALAANKGGTWKAWLSANGENAIDRIAEVGPWYQEPAFGDWVKTFNNKANLATSPLAALITDEQGVVSTAIRGYWTGTLATGKADSGSTCQSWSVGHSSAYGTRGPGSGSWSDETTSGCDQSYGLVCFEQAKLPAPTSGESTRKRVFVTHTRYTGALGGLTGADSLCQTNALAANKGGTWKAWLSANGENAIDRIAEVGPWYQEPAFGDWVKTFNNKANLATSPLAALITDEQGGVVSTASRGYWTGTLATGKADSGRTCQSWSVGHSSAYGTRGPGSGSWSGETTSGCDQSYGVVCLEQ